MSICLRSKAAEDSRTPRCYRTLRSAGTRASVLDCGCPPPLFVRVAIVGHYTIALQIWLLAASFCFLAPLLLCGCAYTVGPVNGVIAKERSVQIVPFANQTLEPHLTDEVTFQLRKILQQDGTYRLATHGDGDVIVSGTILGYERRELNFAATDA